MALVLIIEDDGELRKLLAELLTRAGHQVVAARDGMDGVERFRETLPDVVLTDLSMPRKGGLEVIRELCRQAPCSPIIAMSGDGPDQLLLARRLGARRTFLKPFSFPLLVKTVQEMVNAVRL